MRAVERVTGQNAVSAATLSPLKNLESQIISKIVWIDREPRGKNDQITLGLYEKMFKS